MRPEDEQDIRKSIATINDELGKLWKAVVGVKTDVEWLKLLLCKIIVPLMVSTFLIVLGVLLKLLLT